MGTFRYSYLLATTSKIPTSPTSPLSYKGFAATYDISLPSYLPIHLPLSCPPLLSIPSTAPPTPYTPLLLLLHLLTSIHVINALSPFVLFPPPSILHLFWKKGGPLNVSFSPLFPPIFVTSDPSNFSSLTLRTSLSPSLPAFPRRSGLTSRPFFHRPLRTAPPSGPFVTRLETSLYVCICSTAMYSARYFSFFFPLLLSPSFYFSLTF